MLYKYIILLASALFLSADNGFLGSTSPIFKNQEKKSDIVLPPYFNESIQVFKNQEKRSNKELKNSLYHFHQKVSQILQYNWNQTIETRGNFSATVVVKINKRGKMIYEITESSHNNLFQTKLIVFLEDMKDYNFPLHTFKRKYVDIEIVFKDKIQF